MSDWSSANSFCLMFSSVRTLSSAGFRPFCAQDRSGCASPRNAFSYRFMSFVVSIFFLYSIAGSPVCAVSVNFDSASSCFEFGATSEPSPYSKSSWELPSDASSYVVVFLATSPVARTTSGRMAGLVGMSTGEVVVPLSPKTVASVAGDGVSGVFDGVGAFDVGWADDKDIDSDINSDVSGSSINDLRNAASPASDSPFAMLEICLEISEFASGCASASAVDVSSRALSSFDGALGDANVSLYVCAGTESNSSTKSFDFSSIELKSELFLVLISFAALDEPRASVFSSSSICSPGVDASFAPNLLVASDPVSKACDCARSLSKMDSTSLAVSSPPNVSVSFFFESLGSTEDNSGSSKSSPFVSYASSSSSSSYR